MRIPHTEDRRGPMRAQSCVHRLLVNQDERLTAHPVTIPSTPRVGCMPRGDSGYLLQTSVTIHSSRPRAGISVVRASAVGPPRPVTYLPVPAPRASSKGGYRSQASRETSDPNEPGVERRTAARQVRREAPPSPTQTEQFS